MSPSPLRRALLSVSDKTGVVELAAALHAAGVQLVSTGSTAATLTTAGLPVATVEEVTGSAEMLDGRVKTLHPHIHAAILADRHRSEHRHQLDAYGITPFDLVVVNLYPFKATVDAGAEAEDIIENIDIGGPTLVRAAAKNYAHVAVLTNPDQYSQAHEAIRAGGFTVEQRQHLARAAFAHTAAYDQAVSSWFARTSTDEPSTALESRGASRGQEANFPLHLHTDFEQVHVLRYGENPHQGAALYRDQRNSTGIAWARQIGGKPLSYNNLVDAEAAWQAVNDYSEPAVVIVKHTNPCGVALARPAAAEPLVDAHARAHACDPMSAFGGVIAVNRPVNSALAESVAQIFSEVIVAPGFEGGAQAILSARPALRLLEAPPYERVAHQLRPISGGVLLQASDDVSEEEVDAWQLVSGEAASSSELESALFAWKAVRAVKSNAIVLAQGTATVGVGMGQVNRLDACRLAVMRANTLTEPSAQVQERARGAVAASDAFFPFPDGLELLAEAGARVVVQPGGSRRDDEVIAAAQRAKITMYLTGKRHFSH